MPRQALFNDRAHRLSELFLELPSHLLADPRPTTEEAATLLLGEGYRPQGELDPACHQEVEDPEAEAEAEALLPGTNSIEEGPVPLDHLRNHRATL